MHVFYWENNLEYLEETPEAEGEDANSMDTGQRKKSNPQPKKYAAIMLSFITNKLYFWKRPHSGGFITSWLCTNFNMHKRTSLSSSIWIQMFRCWVVDCLFSVILLNCFPDHGHIALKSQHRNTQFDSSWFSWKAVLLWSWLYLTKTSMTGGQIIFHQLSFSTCFKESQV